MHRCRQQYMERISESTMQEHLAEIANLQGIVFPFFAEKWRKKLGNLKCRRSSNLGAAQALTHQQQLHQGSTTRPRLFVILNRVNLNQVAEMTGGRFGSKRKMRAMAMVRETPLVAMKEASLTRRTESYLI